MKSCAMPIVALLLIGVSPAQAADSVPTLAIAAAESSDAFTRVDAVFEQWDRPDSPGAAVGIIYNGEFIYRRGYGSAHLDFQIPLDADSVFYIASTSKQFAAASIALLAIEGKLDLDADIREYIPEIPDYGTPITARHLVHHTSGLRDYLTLMSIAGRSFENYFNQDTALALASRQRELNFEPGSEHLYSNTGYALIAVLVERVTGKSLREFGEEQFFKPLGMNDTFWDDDHNAIVRNRVQSYRGSANAGYVQYMKNFDAVGSGGLLTTVNDLAKWDANFYDPKVGGQEFIDLLLTRGKLNNGESLHYAFGLGHGEYNGLPHVSHGGGMLGFRTEFIRFPEQKFSVIVLCNLASMDSGALSSQVAEIFLGHSNPTPSGTSPGTVAGIQLPEAELRAKRGDYYHEESGDLAQISLWRGTLRLVRNGTPTGLVATTPLKFQSPSGATVITFDAKGDSEPTRFESTIGGTARTYEAIEKPRYSVLELAEYAGEYYSSELDIPFRINQDRRRLDLARPGQPPFRLNPVVQDRFRGNFDVEFERGDNNDITGFRVHAGRVRNLLFTRVNRD